MAERSFRMNFYPDEPFFPLSEASAAKANARSAAELVLVSSSLAGA